MTIGKRFNQMTLESYLFYIDRYKRYKDFNTLGLYRSLTEESRLTTEEKIIVREYAHRVFRRSFDFLQLKDPYTYVTVSNLGQALTKADEAQLWEDVKKYQQQTLQKKRIRHRSFGVYSKHSCPYEDCIYKGLMLHPSNPLKWSDMHFTGDTGKSASKLDKSIRERKNRKTAQQIIQKEQNME